MAQVINNTNQTIWVAIDVAKFKHDILIEYPNTSKMRIKIANTEKDYQKLLDSINQDGNNDVVAGFEATGDYHRCLIYFLQKNKVNCRLISSIATARTREAMHQTWDKHDKKDTNVILHLLKSNFTQTYHDPLLHNLNDTQELSNTYHQISKRKTRLQHSLKNHYFTLYFPEAEKFMHSTRGNWFINLLIEFPCPSAITGISKSYFIEKGCLIKGKKQFKQRWLEEFYEV